MEDKELKELEAAVEPIWEIAHRFGLDPFPVHFELVPPSIMYESARTAFRGAFRIGRTARCTTRMKTSYDYGLSKIYELVVNTNPSYAFLMEGNSLVQNKLVIAHVLGHCDFLSIMPISRAPTAVWWKPHRSTPTASGAMSSSTAIRRWSVF